jgi:hypothetical protein
MTAWRQFYDDPQPVHVADAATTPQKAICGTLF